MCIVMNYVINNHTAMKQQHNKFFFTCKTYSTCVYNTPTEKRQSGRGKLKFCYFCSVGM